MKVSKEFIKKDGLSIRKYEDYTEYVEHQKSKLSIITWLDKYDVDYREILLERLKTLDLTIKGKSVLCLAARMGTEVKAFLDMGAFAVGIDLNPGEDNMWVVKGDFHDIQYPNDSVDIVFINSIDHSLKPSKLISEIKRVIKDEGRFIMEIGREGTTGYYECLEWENIDQMIKLFKEEGFNLLSRKPFNKYKRYVCGGEQLFFKI